MEEILINVNLQGENKIDNLAKKSVEASSSVSKLKSELKAAQAELDKLTSDSAQYSAALQKATNAQIRLTTAKTTATQVNKALSLAIKENIGLGSQISAVNNASKAAFDSLIATLYSYNATTDKTTANTIKVVNALEAYIGATNSVSTANQNANVTTEGLNRAAQSSAANFNAASGSMVSFSNSTQQSVISFRGLIELIEYSKGSLEDLQQQALTTQGKLIAEYDSLTSNTKKSAVEFGKLSDELEEQSMTVNTLSAAFEEAKKAQNEFNDAYNRFTSSSQKLYALKDGQEEYNQAVRENNKLQEDAARAAYKAEQAREKLNNVAAKSNPNYRLNNNLMTQFNMILRETPNFAIDARIGIMSLSNNIPYLVEALENAKKSGMTMKDLWTSLKPAIFGVQGAFLAATVALTAFSNPKFVEWLGNIFGAIPKNLKIKLELEESIIKDTQKAMEKIAQIRQNMILASNKKEFDLLKEKLVEEGIATKEQLKGLNDWKALENAAFWAEYLKNVKLVAENEFKIKRDIELRLQKELKESQLKSIVSERNREGSIGLSFEIRKRRKELKELEKEIKAFQDISYKNGELDLLPTAFDIGIKKSSTTTSIKDIKEAPFQMEGLYEGLRRLEERAKVLKELGTIISPVAVDVDKIVNEAENRLKITMDGIIASTPSTFRDTKLKSAEELRRELEVRMQAYMEMATSIGTISDAVVGMDEARMTVIDNYYDKEARLIEQSTLNEEAKNKKLDQLDKERYEQQKILFERQKQFRIATVYADLASGLMGIYTRATRIDAPPSPLNWIAAGVETAAITAQSIASIKNINAQQIQAPSGGSSGSTSNLSNIALNPTKTALTTKEENLNMIQKSGENSQSVVRVSEINEVQNRVSVREKNSQF